MKLLKVRNKEKVLSIGDSVWLVDTNDRSKKGREAFVVSIGTKLIGCSTEKDAEKASYKFDFEGKESGPWCHNAFYFSKQDYIDSLLAKEFIWKLSDILKYGSWEKDMTEEKISQICNILGISKELETVKNKVNKIFEE